MIKRKHIILTPLLFFGLLLNAQVPYELLFIQGNYEAILEQGSSRNERKDFYWMAIAYGKTGHITESIEILKKGLSLYENDSAMEVLFAEQLFNSGQYSSSKPLLLKHSKSPDLFIKLIRVLEFESDHLHAIELLSEKLKHDSLNIELLTHLGDNNYQVNNLVKSIEAYQKVVRINPNDQRSLGRLANLYLESKLFRESIATCDSALAMDSTNLRMIRIKGLACFRSSNFELAAKCFQSIYESGDSSLVILKHLGIAESKSYAYHDSRAHLLEAYKLDSLDHEICYFLGRGFLNSRFPAKGLFYVDRADSLLQADPEIMAVLHMERVAIYETLKDYNKALEHYLIAYEFNPKPEYLFFIASIYQNRFGQKKTALEFYERFLEALPPIKETEDQSLRGQQNGTLRSAAENTISELKEELFFEGALNEED